MSLRLLSAILTCLYGAFLLAVPAPAQAQSCSYSIDNMDFGSIRPIDNDNIFGQATFRATCSGDADQTVKVCMNLGVGSGSPEIPFTPRKMTSGTNQLNYEIYSDPARTQRWGSLNTGGSGVPPALFIELPSTAGTQVTGTQTLYFRIFAGQQSAASGPYFADFASNHTGASAVYASGGACTVSGIASAGFSVSASVDEDCDVTADTMDFGTHGVLDENIDSSAAIRVTCTPMTSYTLTLGNGQNGTSAATRKMAMGDDEISYGLYSDTQRNQLFGSQPGETMGGTGTGMAVTTTVYGRVPPQKAPPAGTYDDIVVVTVAY